MLYEFEDMELEFINNKVEYTGASDVQVNYGGGSDPRGILELGKEYAVSDCDVHSWKTYVYLEEFPGKKFNSVFFSIKEQ